MNNVRLNGQCIHGVPGGIDGGCDKCNNIYKNKAAIHEPDPIKTINSIKVLDLVRKDLEDRAEVGNKKYGTYLMTHNGRNVLMDAYQEALDLCMYLRQLIYEDELSKNN